MGRAAAAERRGESVVGAPAWASALAAAVGGGDQRREHVHESTAALITPPAAAPTLEQAHRRA